MYIGRISKTKYLARGDLKGETLNNNHLSLGNMEGILKLPMRREKKIKKQNMEIPRIFY